MVFPLIFRAGAVALPFLGRGALALGKGVGRFLTTRTGQAALFTGSIAVTSPAVRKLVKQDPTLLIPQVAVGKAVGRFIEGESIIPQTQISAAPPLSTPAFDPETGRPRFKTNGLSPLERGAIAIGGAGIGGLILSEVIRRRKKKEKAPSIPAQQIPTPLPAAPPISARPSPIGRIPVTPVSPDIPTQVMQPTDKLISAKPPTIRLTANPKINVVIQNSIN